MKKLTWLLSALILLLVAGCDEREYDRKLREKNEASFAACIDNGGVPIQSWFNDNVLGDCKFPPKNN